MNLNGEFRLELPPGTYKLRLTVDNYFDAAIDHVVVTAGKLTEAATVMANRASGTRVEVVENLTAVEATAQAMLTERKLAPVVSDFDQ